MGLTPGQRERWDRITAMYRDGVPMDEIATREGVDRRTVYNVARRAGLPNRHVFDEARRTRILEAYSRGDVIREIAEREGVVPTYVSTLARRAGLPRRKGWRRRYPIDESVFDQPTPVGWWLIGLLAADGYIHRHDNGITLCQGEAGLDVLHAFLRYVGCPERPLTQLRLSPVAAARAWPRSPAYEARIHSARIKAALARHGVVPGKTHGLRLGQEAADQPAVWLGILDGDGWVSDVTRQPRATLSFAGTPDLMRQCSRFWESRLAAGGRRPPAVRKHVGGLATVKLHGARAASAATLLLEASPVSLKRKRRSLEAILAKYGRLA